MSGWYIAGEIGNRQYMTLWQAIARCRSVLNNRSPSEPFDGSTTYTDTYTFHIHYRNPLGMLSPKNVAVSGIQSVGGGQVTLTTSTANRPAPIVIAGRSPDHVALEISNQKIWFVGKECHLFGRKSLKALRSLWKSNVKPDDADEWIKLPDVYPISILQNIVKYRVEWCFLDSSICVRNHSGGRLVLNHALITWFYGTSSSNNLRNFTSFNNYVKVIDPDHRLHTIFVVKTDASSYLSPRLRDSYKFYERYICSKIVDGLEERGIPWTYDDDLGLCVTTDEDYTILRVIGIDGLVINE